MGEIGLTPRAKKVIELAVDEARRFNHHYIGTEHLLLGLVREGEGIAAGVLESLGVNLEKVRSQTIQVLSQSGKLQGGVASGLTAMSGESMADTAVAPRFVPPTPSRAVRGRQGPLGTLVLGVGLLTLGLAVAEALLAYAQNILPASAQVAAVGTLKFGWTAAVLVIMLVLCAERQRTGYVLALITGILFATLGLLGHPYNELFYDQSGPFQPNATGPWTTLQLALTIAGGALAVSALLALLLERRSGRVF